MKWSIKENKKGTRCVITCDEGVRFLRANVVFRKDLTPPEPQVCPACHTTLKTSKDLPKVEVVRLLVPCGSWKK